MIRERLQLTALAEKGWCWSKWSIRKLGSQGWTFLKHHGEPMLYKYPWDEKSASTSVVGMSKAAICLSRWWVRAAEDGAWCRKHAYKFCQANPNWACHFELSIHKPQIRSKSSLTKVTGSHFSKDVIKHYILTTLLLRCTLCRRCEVEMRCGYISWCRWLRISITSNNACADLSE